MADFETLNDLPAEVKVLIVQGQTLVDETRKKVKERGWEVDMTGKMQLKTDCADVEKAIAKLSQSNGKGGGLGRIFRPQKEQKISAKDIERLRIAIIRLQTSSDGLLNRRQC